MAISLRKRAGLVMRSLFANVENTVGPLNMLSQITQGRGEPPKRGTVDFLRLYNENPNIRGVTHKIGYSVASTEWRIMVQRNSRGKVVRAKQLQRCRDHKQRREMVRLMRKAGELEEIPDHPMLDALYKPNPILTGLEVRQLTQVWLDLVGEAFWIIRRNDFGMPVEFWPVPPTWVVAFPTTDFPYFEMRFRSWSGHVPETEMICFRYPDPINPYGRGSGTVMSLRDEVDVDEYAAKHKRQWFYNRARPDLIIMPAGDEGNETLDPDEMKPVEERWLERSQGFWNAFKPLFLTKKVMVTPLSQTFEQMDMVNLREFEKQTIRQNFGVPPEILGQTQDSNRATMETADFIMAKYTTVPRLEYQREILQENVAPQYDENIIVEYVSPVEEDHQRKLDTMKSAPWVPNSDEWRDAMGLEPDESGRTYHAVPIGLALVEDLSELADQASEEPTGGDPFAEIPEDDEPDEDVEDLDDVGEDDEGPEAMAASARPQRRKVAFKSCVKVEAGKSVAPLVKAGPDDEFYGIIHAISDKLQPVMVRRLYQAFKAIETGIDIPKLMAAITSGSADAAVASLPWLELSKQLGAIDTQIIRGAFQLSGEQSAAEVADVLGIGMSFDLEHPNAVTWAQKNGARLVKQVTEETKAAIRTVIADSIKEGRTAKETARIIAGNNPGKDGLVGLLDRDARALMRRRAAWEAEGVPAEQIRTRLSRAAKQMIRRRSRVIARTELVNATNGGQQSLWEQGLARGELDYKRTTKQVVVTPDDRLDFKVCEPMPWMIENQNLRITDPFTTGKRALVMQPGFHTNCRCGMRIVVSA